MIMTDCVCDFTQLLMGFNGDGNDDVITKGKQLLSNFISDDFGVVVSTLENNGVSLQHYYDGVYDDVPNVLNEMFVEFLLNTSTNWPKRGVD